MKKKQEEKKMEWHHVVTMTHLDGLKRKFNVAYDPVGVKMATDQAAKEVGKRVQVKGYRKGKAPLPLVIKYYRDKVDSAVETMLSQGGFILGCSENKVSPLDQPEVSKAKFNQDGSFSCEITFESMPNIELSGYLGIKLPKPAPIDLEESFQSLLGHVRQQFVTEINKDVLEEDMIAVLKFCLRAEGKEISSGEDQKFKISKGQEAPFGENLLGMKVGETKVESMTLPKEFGKMAGMEADVEVTLTGAIQTVDPTDDELAQRAEAPSYEELVKKIREKASLEAKRKEVAALEEKLVDKLIAMHPFQVPISWVEEEEKYLQNQLGMSAVDEETRKYLRHMSERNVRRTFILEAIYKEEKGIHLTQEEFDSYIEVQAKQQDVSTLVLKDNLVKQGLTDGVIAMLKNKKVIDLLLRNVQFEEEKEEVKVPVTPTVPENPFE